MKAYLSAAACIAALGLAAAPAAFAQLAPAPAAQPAAQPKLAMTLLPARGRATLVVTSPAFAAGGDIPFENTQYRANIFPGLAWSAGPAGTKSYAVIMQDTDGIMRGGYILHWTLYDIPANVTKLDAAMAGPPAGSSYGPNMRGPAQPYAGPRPPPGPKHHYHLQVFALDTAIPASPTLTYDDLIQAMAGHILASGELVGLAMADPTAPPPAPRPPAN
jgi:para-nitrobenzyl esterase